LRFSLDSSAFLRKPGLDQLFDFTMKTFAKLLIGLALLPCTGLAQEIFDISAGRLTGQRTAETELILLEGNVRIVHETTIATADTGYYDKTSEVIELLGHVVIEQGKVELKAQRARYERLRRVASFPEGIDASEDSITLSADWGRYDLSNDVITMRGHVLYSEGSRQIFADSARYDRRAGIIDASGGIVMKETNRGAVLRAEAVRYNRQTGYGIARGEPWLEIERSDRKTATSIAADSMEIFADESKAVAVGDVEIIRDTAIATCQRAIFLDNENRTVLIENPVIVDGKSSLSGETITVFTSDDQISRVMVSGNAKSIYHPPHETRTDLKGDEINLSFSDGQLQRVEVVGEASAVFGETAAGTRNEVNGASIVIDFEGGKARTAAVGGGGESGKLEVVRYSSDSLHYDVPGSLMNLKGGAKVEYGRMKLLSDLIQYNSSTNDLYAPRNPVLWEGEDKITGVALSYNLQTKRGAIVAGRTAYDRGLYVGSLIRKTGERTLNVEGGTYTSCNLADPHYTFSSSKMKMYVNDKVITRPLVLRIRGVPILALPFFIFPIRKGRHSGILIPRIEFGFDEDRGRFVRNAGYYWAPNDYFDLTLWADYYERSRWIAHAEARYKVRYLLTGSFKGSYLKDINTGASRWDVGGSHTQEIGDGGRLIVHADFVSDKTYRRETSDILEEQLRRTLESDVSYSSRWRGGSFTVAAERRENLDTDQVTQALPRFSLLLSKVTLIEPSDAGWHRGTYLTASTSGSNTLAKTTSTRKGQQQARVNVKIDSDLRFGGRSQNLRSSMVVSSVRKDLSEWCSGCTGGKVVNTALSDRIDFIAKFLPFGWLNFDPSLAMSFTIYDDDRQGNRLPTRFMYWGGFSTTASIYRTYFPRLGPLRALRHVITPRISFTHRPDFSRYRGRFFNLPGISGEVSKASIVNLSLTNRLQAKVQHDSQVRKIDNLLSLETSTSYDLLYKDKGLKTPFSTISNHLRIYPSGHATLDVTFTNDPVDLSFESLNATVNFSYSGAGPLPPGFSKPETKPPEVVPEEGVGGSDVSPPTEKPWHVGAIFRYTRAYDSGRDSYWLDLTAGFNLSTNWRIEYSGRFDLANRQTAYQEYSIYRDLHCWEAQFVRRYSGSEWQYYFRISIKAHPEVYTERGLRALYRRY